MPEVRGCLHGPCRFSSADANSFLWHMTSGCERFWQVATGALLAFAAASSLGAAPAPSFGQTNSQPGAFPAPRFKIPKRVVSGFPLPRIDPAKVAIGERLFLETRFAQFFFAHSKGDANATLVQGDPVMATTVTTGQPLPGPFRGFAMNCRACHLVGEQFAIGHGNRT